MEDRDKENQGTGDYRTSHLKSGASYDDYIADTPFDAYMARWEKEHLVRLANELFPDGIPRYLDFACGTGRITQTVEPLARESHGVDVSEGMLVIARAKCSATRFQQADLTRGQLDLGSFDLVTSFRFFGNAQDDLRRSALATMNALLREGGYLVINNHRNPHSIMEVLHRVSGGTPHEMDLHWFKLRRLLHQHGFTITRQCAIGFWIFRAKLADERLAGPGAGRLLESLLGHSFAVPFAPDAIIAARKTRTVT